MTTRYRANEMAAADTISGKLQRHCLMIIVEHRAAGPDSIPTSMRFVYYELVQASIISKHATGARRPDFNVSDALMQLRRIGLVPRMRSPTKPASYCSGSTPTRSPTTLWIGSMSPASTRGTENRRR